MLSLEVLVGELLAIDRLATGALASECQHGGYGPSFSSSHEQSTDIASSEITALQHELRDDAVEFATLVAESLLAGAEGTEVLGRLWDYIVVELEVDPGLLGCIGER